MEKGPYRLFLTMLLALINFVHILDFMIMMPMSPILIGELKISSTEFGILVSSYGISAFFAGVLGIRFLDRFDRKSILLTTLGLFLLGTFLCSQADSYYSLLTMRALTGFFGGVIGATVSSIVSDMYPPQERGSAMGILMTGFALASIVGVPIGLWLVGKSDWQYPFLLIAIVGAVLWLIVLIFMPAFRKHLIEKRAPKSFLQIVNRVFSNESQRNAIFLNFTLILGHFIIIPCYALFMVRNVGIGDDNLQYLYLMGGLINVIVSPIVGKMTDRLGPKKIFPIVLIGACVPVLITTNLPQSPLWVAFGVTALFFLIAGSRMVPLAALSSMVVKAEDRGSFESLRSSSIQLASAISSFIGGAVVSSKHYYVDYYWVAGILSVTITLCCLFFLPRIKPIQE